MANTPQHNTLFTRTTPVAKSAVAARVTPETPVARPAANPAGTHEIEAALESLAAVAAAGTPKSPILQSPVDKSPVDKSPAASPVASPAVSPAPSSAADPTPPGSNLFARIAVTNEPAGKAQRAASSAADPAGSGSSGSSASGASSSGGKPPGAKSSRAPNPKHRRIYVSTRLKQAREEMSACRSKMQSKAAKGAKGAKGEKGPKDEAAQSVHRDAVFARVRFQEIRKEIAALRAEMKTFTRGPGKAAPSAATTA